MKIDIWGYGGELVVGSITREQYVYWRMQEDEELTEHVFGNDDPEDIDESLRLSEWHDLDDIEHVNGASYDSTTYISVEDDSGKEIFNLPITDLVNIEGCENAINWEAGFDTDDADHDFVFMAYSAEKGSFGGLIIPDDNFDPKKLSFTVREVEGFQIIDGIFYDHPDAVNSEEYSTSGKSWECWLISTNPDNEDED